MEILFLANGAFAVPTLAALVEVGFSLDLVAMPDPPAGRRGRPVPSPVAAWARGVGVALRQPGDLSDPDFLAAVRAKRFLVGFAVDYGRRIPRALFESPRFGIWNLHPSLLPRYRGAAPIPWALLNGDAETGVTLFRIVERMDAGPILLQRVSPVRPDDDAVTLHARLARVAADLAREGLARLAERSLAETPQDESRATVARKLVKADGRVDWTAPAEKIVRQVRALKPWPGAYTAWRHPRRGLVTLHLEEAAAAPAREPPLAPGEVYCDGGIAVGTGRGELRIRALKPEGGTVLAAAAFLRGYPLVSGERLSAPEG